MAENSTAAGDKPVETPISHQPFSLEERIQQLCEIDKSIVQVMDYAAKAIGALGPRPASVSQSEQTDDFKTSMEGLLETLHDVDVHMKRQILGLEEAGIIRLRQDTKVMSEDARIVVKPSLEPNGVGSIGNLDVGWLNSRNSKVERDMEAELWGSMKTFLEAYTDGQGGGKSTS